MWSTTLASALVGLLQAATAQTDRCADVLHQVVDT